MHDSSEYPPGSIYAVEAGCKCPRLDNNHGAGCGNGLFVTRPDCPIHGQIDADEYDDEERAGLSDTKEID